MNAHMTEKVYIKNDWSINDHWETGGHCQHKSLSYFCNADKNCICTHSLQQLKKKTMTFKTVKDRTEMLQTFQSLQQIMYHICKSISPGMYNVFFCKSKKITDSWLSARNYKTGKAMAVTMPFKHVIYLTKWWL